MEYPNDLENSFHTLNYSQIFKKNKKYPKRTANRQFFMLLSQVYTTKKFWSKYFENFLPEFVFCGENKIDRILFRLNFQTVHFK